MVAVLVPPHETALEQVTAARLPGQLCQSPLFPERRGLRDEGARGGRQVVQDLLFLPDDMSKHSKMQAIAHQRASDLTVQLPAARQLASELTGDQVGAIEPLRLERGAERSLDHIPACEGHDFH